MTARRTDTPQAGGADSVAHDGAGDVLSEVLKLVEEWPVLDDLTKGDREQYIKSLAELDRAIKRIRKIADTSVASPELLSLMAYAIFQAHEIGTYKTPTQSSPEKGVLNVLLTSRTKRPTAEYVSLLEKFDTHFKHRREKMKAQELRDAKTERGRDRETALMAAVKGHLGTDTSEQPAKDADRIVELVNQDLAAKGFDPVSSTTIYRRLLKFPRS